MEDCMCYDLRVIGKDSVKYGVGKQLEEVLKRNEFDVAAEDNAIWTFSHKIPDMHLIAKGFRGYPSKGPLELPRQRAKTYVDSILQESQKFICTLRELLDDEKDREELKVLYLISHAQHPDKDDEQMPRFLIRHEGLLWKPNEIPEYIQSKPGRA